MTTKPKPFTPSAATPIGPEHVGWAVKYRDGTTGHILSVNDDLHYPVSTGAETHGVDGMATYNLGSMSLDIIRVEPPGWKAPKPRKRKPRRPDPAKAKPGEVWRIGAVTYIRQYPESWGWVGPRASGFTLGNLPVGARRIAAAPKKGKK